MNRKDVKVADLQEEPKVSGLASTIDFHGELYHENLGLQNRPQLSAPPLEASPAPGTFTLLYESQDGRLCLFEDEQGHLTCVRSDRFA